MTAKVYYCDKVVHKFYFVTSLVIKTAAVSFTDGTSINRFSSMKSYEGKGGANIISFFMLKSSNLYIGNDWVKCFWANLSSSSVTPGFLQSNRIGAVV